MDQTLALLLHACNLARHLESNLLPHINNSEALSKSCDEIIAVFLACKERLSLSGNPQQGGLSGQPPWLMKCSSSNPSAMTTMEMFQAADHDQVANTTASMGMTTMEVAPGAPSSSSGGVRFGGGGAAGSQQRPRRRKNEADRKTIRVPVPRVGNTEIPPEDGFTWRKYGQKEILGSRFPRGYFRCTHQKLYNCRAKKQVQRLDHDPDTYEVTYRGRHTCHMSTTAPSVGPAPEEPHTGPSVTSALQQVITAAAQQQQSTARWAMEFRLGQGGGGRDQHHHQQQQVDFPVSDMAAAMFSSGSSSTNASMDLIFNAAMDAHDQDKQSDDRGKGKA